MSFEIRVILARPLYETNIGAVSRVMTNMGARQLIILGPQCEIGYAAQQAAATGQEPLQNRVVYQDWNEFFQKDREGVRIALTPADGKIRQVYDLKEIVHNLRVTPKKTMPAYLDLVLGPENWGLSNEDLDHCHFACSLPTYGPNTSLNLAQAALLSLFITQETLGEKRTTVYRGLDDIKQKPTPFPDQLVKDWLTALGFEIDERRINVYIILKKMLMHQVPTSKELKAFSAVLNQNLRKIYEYNKMRKEKGLPHIDKMDHAPRK